MGNGFEFSEETYIAYAKISNGQAKLNVTLFANYSSTGSTPLTVPPLTYHAGHGFDSAHQLTDAQHYGFLG